MQANEYAEAVHSYGRALALISSSSTAPSSGGGLLGPVLLNLSATHLKLQQVQQALRFAAAAVALSGVGEGGKAYYRAALAPDGLGLNLAAHTAMRKALERLEGVKSQQLLSQISPLSSSAGRVEGGGGGGGRRKDAKLAAVAVLSAEDMLKGHEQMLHALAMAVAASTEVKPPAAMDSSDRNNGSGGCSEDLVRAAAEAKEAGNTGFNEERFSDALASYRTALSCLARTLPSALLLSNRAACFLQMGRSPGRPAAAAAAAGRLQSATAGGCSGCSTDTLHDALMDAVAALTISCGEGAGATTSLPTELLVKAWHRACTALLRLGWLAEARAVCQVALQVAPLEASLSDLMQRVTTAAGADPGTTTGSSRDAPPQLHDDAGRPLSSHAEAGPAGPSGSSSGSSAGTSGSSSSRAKKGKGKHKGQGGSSRAPGYVTEREIKDMERKEKSSTETVAALNNMLAFMQMTQPGMAARAMAEARCTPGMLQLETRVPPYHLDFAKQGRWGVGGGGRCVGGGGFRAVRDASEENASSWI